MLKNNQLSLLEEIETKKAIEGFGEFDTGDFEKDMDRIKALPEEERRKIFELPATG